MEQVLLNLAVNARDAMPDGGTLSFETGIAAPDQDFWARHPDMPRGPLALLVARDTGSGMTEAVKAHVFEPFFTTKERGKGTGLGLSMVYGIIKQSGGEIEIESAPGRGTTFNVYLPRVDTAAPAAERDAGTKLVEVLRGNETVLLVEDEEMVRNLATRVLTANGYFVLSAANGPEALALLARHGKPVDVLVTDVVMPGMSGRDLSKEIAKKNFAHRTLFISGYTDDAIVHHGVLEPGLAFLNKPFTLESLLRKLREVLDGPAGQARP
jgi:CheY-like chemotaxis protein